MKDKIILAIMNFLASHYKGMRNPYLPEDYAKKLDYGDAQRSAQMAYGMIDKAIQEGSSTATQDRGKKAGKR